MTRNAILMLGVDAVERALIAQLAPRDWPMRVLETPQLEAQIPDLADVTVLSVFVHSRVDRALLSRLPSLKLVAARSTGFDHIDLVACRERGVAVCNVPEYGSATVAEHTFALLLALSRRIYEARQRTLHGSFSYSGLTGFDLQGKVFGIAGFGRIGQHAARIAAGFGMRVLAHDPALAGERAAALGVEPVDWDTLLALSDIVSLHVPGTDANRHLMDAHAFRRMKPGAILINTARGSLVDEAALLQAIDSGQLAGAGLDVLEDEQGGSQEDAGLRCDALACGHWSRLAREHPLMVHPRVLVTPHIGFNSREAVARIVQTTVENITAFLSGTPRNRIA